MEIPKNARVFLEFDRFLRERDEERFKRVLGDLTEVRDLVVNPVAGCNLSCKHCSYAIDVSRRELIPLNDLRIALSEAAVYGVRRVIILGREPLLVFDERTKPVLEQLDLLKRGFSGLKYGLVTNGTLVPAHIDSLREHDFDYIDVSLDGVESDNDANRGEGNFKRAVKGIELILKNRLTNNLHVSAVAMRYNYRNLSTFVRDMTGRGVRRFSIGTYIYTGENPKDWVIGAGELYSLVDDLKETSRETDHVIIDIHTHVIGLWKHLVDQGVIVEDDVRVDTDGNVFYRVPDSNVLIRNSMFTTNFWNSAVISPDGHYLADYEYSARRDYKKFSMGRISDAPFEMLVDRARRVEPARFVRKVLALEKQGFDYGYLTRDG
jgi:sulfatase maturation enzyme AslB (radical SAM superfamily)